MSKNRFAGGFEACLNDLVSVLTENEELFLKIREQISELCNVDYLTVEKWLRGENRPIGVILIKLQHVLSRLGYYVNEMEKMSPIVWSLGEMILFKLVSFDDIIEYVSINKRQTLSLNLQGKVTPSSENLRKMKDLVTEYENLLLESQSRVDLVSLFENPKKSEIQSEESFECLNHEQTLQKVADLILQLGPLAEKVLSDEYTWQERKRLRVLTNVDGVHIAANHLNRLTSESSRNDIPTYDGGRI